MLLLKTFPIKDVSTLISWRNTEWMWPRVGVTEVCLLGASWSNHSQEAPPGKVWPAALPFFQNTYCWRPERVKHGVCGVGGVVVTVTSLCPCVSLRGEGEWAEDEKGGVPAPQTRANNLLAGRGQHAYLPRVRSRGGFPTQPGPWLQMVVLCRSWLWPPALRPTA